MGLVLIGMMGSGKTTLGRIVAKRVGLKHIDLDAEIEAATGMTITEIFRTIGERRFRAMETETLRRWEGNRGVVLSTGGGAPATTGNLEIMRTIGPVVYLRAHVEVLASRIRRSRALRPLVAEGELVPKLRELLRLRSGAYESADHILDVDQLGRADVIARLCEIATECG
jgi:shikimate kinase